MKLRPGQTMLSQHVFSLSGLRALILSGVHQSELRVSVCPVGEPLSLLGSSSGTSSAS